MLRQFDYKQCAKHFLESNYSCGGCYFDSKCLIYSKSALKHARNTLEFTKNQLERNSLISKILRLQKRILENE